MFLKYWINLFGSPNTVFNDNGGEFPSKEFIDFCKNFNMNVKTTAAEAPCSNGICERQNAILKVRNDTVIGKLPLLGQLMRKTVL